MLGVCFTAAVLVCTWSSSGVAGPPPWGATFFYEADVELPMTTAVRARIVHQARAASRARRREIVEALLRVALADDAGSRREIAAALVELGGLSRGAARRLPLRAAVERRLARLLARRGLDLAMACRLVVAGERPRGTLVVESTGTFCPDGSYLDFRATLGLHGWHIERARVEHHN